MLQSPLFIDALLAGMKAAPVSLRRAITKKHHREIGRELWQESMLAVHLQDNRLTEKERQVLAAIGSRLHGHRSVL